MALTKEMQLAVHMGMRAGVEMAEVAWLREALGEIYAPHFTGKGLVPKDRLNAVRTHLEGCKAIARATTRSAL